MRVYCRVSGKTTSGVCMRISAVLMKICPKSAVTAPAISATAKDVCTMRRVCLKSRAPIAMDASTFAPTVSPANRQSRKATMYGVTPMAASECSDPK